MATTFKLYGNDGLLKRKQYAHAAVRMHALTVQDIFLHRDRL